MFDTPEDHDNSDIDGASDSSSQPQPSIWGKSQPSRLIPENRVLEVFLGDTLIAKSDKVIQAVGRNCATSTFYVPRQFVRMRYLKPEKQKMAHCKWRGKADYFNVDTGSRSSNLAACHYQTPIAELEDIADHVCFHPARVTCYLDGERVWAERDQTPSTQETLLISK